jgi:hypothetical protein
VIANTTAVLGVSAAGAATTRHAAGCETTVSGAAWKIKGLGSGRTYTLKAARMPCATAKKWTVMFSKETETGKTLKGTPATAIFVWAPKP